MVSHTTNDFPKNVFINCPFDTEYEALLRPMLFTVVYLGYSPRIASESFNSFEQRINKISDLIGHSKFCIHDVSRMQAKQHGDLYRLNLPFELGIDYGCKLFKGGDAQGKICLVLDEEQYRYHRVLSDLSGIDIKKHDKDPETIVRQIRNWFVENELETAPSATVIWENFNEFMADFYQKRKEDGFQGKDLDMMPVPEFIHFIKEWLVRKGIL